jgi:hypothetical protein
MRWCALVRVGYGRGGSGWFWPAGGVWVGVESLVREPSDVGLLDEVGEVCPCVPSRALSCVVVGGVVVGEVVVGEVAVGSVAVASVTGGGVPVVAEGSVDASAAVMVPAVSADSVAAVSVEVLGISSSLRLLQPASSTMNNGRIANFISYLQVG